MSFIEAFLLFTVVAIIIFAIVYPMWKNGTISTCVTTSPTTGVCFPNYNLTVKSGLIDLRHCNDDFYIMVTNRAKVHFIEDVT